MADPLEHPDSTMPASVGPFRIVGALGGGGMGDVYLGERLELFSQRVAIKVLHAARRGDGASEDAYGTAVREEDVLVSLDHSNIVRLLDRGVTDGGLRYIVMEYVDGVAIDVFCDERRLSVRERIRLLMQVMDAVAYAHRHLVVHADLKPANILVTSAGEVSCGGRDDCG
jgi:serine/threonine protein kinase